jgi:hypothetical protein
LLGTELDREDLLGVDLLGALRAYSVRTSNFNINASECGLLHGSS